MTNTVPASGQFGPNTFLVQTLSEMRNNLPGTVAAKFLTDSSGNYLINPNTSQPYIVPADYDPPSVVQTYANIADTALANAQTGPIATTTDILSNAQASVYNTFVQNFVRGGSGD